MQECTGVRHQLITAHKRNSAHSMSRHRCCPSLLGGGDGGGGSDGGVCVLHEIIFLAGGTGGGGGAGDTWATSMERA